MFDVSALPERCRLEMAVVLQARHDERGRGLRPAAVRPVVAMIAASGVGLERIIDALEPLASGPDDDNPSTGGGRGRRRPRSTDAEHPEVVALILDSGGLIALTAEIAALLHWSKRPAGAERGS